MSRNYIVDKLILRGQDDVTSQRWNFAFLSQNTGRRMFLQDGAKKTTASISISKWFFGGDEDCTTTLLPAQLDMCLGLEKNEAKPTNITVIKTSQICKSTDKLGDRGTKWEVAWNERFCHSEGIGYNSRWVHHWPRFC